MCVYVLECLSAAIHQHACLAALLLIHDTQYGGVLQSADNVDTLLPWVLACLEVVLNTVNAHAHECFPGEVPKEIPDEVLADSLHTSMNEEKIPGKKSITKQTSFGGLGMAAEAGRQCMFLCVCSLKQRSSTFVPTLASTLIGCLLFDFLTHLVCCLSVCMYIVCVATLA